MPSHGSFRKSNALRRMTMGAMRSCTRLNLLLRLGLGDETACDDGDHRNPDVPGKEVGGAVVHDVEPAVAAEPGKQQLHNPPDPVRQEAPVPRAARRDRDMDVMLERCRGEGRALEAAVA